MKTKQKFMLIIGVFLTFSIKCLAESSTSNIIHTQTKQTSIFPTVISTVFNIPLFACEGIDSKILHLTENTLTYILDRNNSGTPDNLELVSYMVNKGYKVVLADRALELDNLDESLFPNNKTAFISSQGMRADSYLTETLKLVAQAYVDKLGEQAKGGDTHSKKEISLLNSAIRTMRGKGFQIESDVDDEIEMADYIAASEMVLADQFKTFFDRMIGGVELMLRKVAEQEGKTFNREEDIGNHLKPYKAWYEASPQSFKEQAPEICEWLERNQLSSTSQVIPTTPLVIDDLSIQSFITDPFDFDDKEE